MKKQLLEVLEKKLTELSDVITILKTRPTEHIEARFHEEVTVPMKSLTAYCENLEATYFFDLHKQNQKLEVR